METELEQCWALGMAGPRQNETGNTGLKNAKMGEDKEETSRPGVKINTGAGEQRAAAGGGGQQRRNGHFS